tara:strand:+ start:649 stop:2052 length:1404 start_codon:yes stop_codon:yes gene_type:complete
MPLILGTNSIKDTGYNVANSLRFNDGSSDYLNRTPSSAGNRRTFTISVWLKIGLNGAYRTIIGAGGGATRDRLQIFNNDTLVFNLNDSTDAALISSQVLRDPSSWYHVVCAVDTTQSTSSNRVKLYLNGSQITSFGTSNYPTQNYDCRLNNNIETFIGQSSANNFYYDGYMTEFVFIDGQALDPTSFGEFNSDSPTIWQPIDVSGLTFGTNGFYLDFEDSSALGNDVSGNNNDFTVNNLTSADQSTDTCTLNYSTMNPIQNLFGKQTFSNGNLQINSPSGDAAAPHSTFGVSSGRWYVEAKLDSAGSNQSLIGVSSNEATQTDYHIGRGATSYGIFSANGKIYNNNDSGTSYGSGYSAGNIIGIYLDLEDNKLYFSVNGTLQNSGTGHSITAVTSTELGFYFFSGMQWDNAQSCQWSFNFGSPTYANTSSNTDDNGYGDFEYSPNITGDGSAKKFYALNSKNLAEFG